MKVYRLAAVAVAGMSWGLAPAWGDEAPKWGAHIDLEGKLGTDRHLGEVDLFLPVAQDGRTLLFADIRTRMDDAESREGNFGLGLRHMLDAGWNLGGYAFFDRRRTEHHNYYNQVTVGAEALSLDWDVRANVYAPIGRTTRQVESLNTAELSGTSVIFRGGEERALGGFDAEIGWRVPLFEAEAGQQLRLYAGGYRFADDGVPTVAGPRGRAEMVFDEVPGLWDGSRLSIGAEWQRDDPRGSQGFLSARLRIPLQAEAKASRLTPMERRMADPIVRDVDLVAQAGTFGPAETVTQAANGGDLKVFDSATTTDLPTAVLAAKANSTVVLSGTFNTSNVVTLLPGQTLMGAGTVSVRSPSGRTATLALPGGTISTSGTSGKAILATGGTTVSGLIIIATLGDSGSEGIELASGAENITISNNVISVSKSSSGSPSGISGWGNTNLTISGNTITLESSPLWPGSAVEIVNSMNVTIANNTVYTYGGAQTLFT